MQVEIIDKEKGEYAVSEPKTVNVNDLKTQLEAVQAEIADIQAQWDGRVAEIAGHFGKQVSAKQEEASALQAQLDKIVEQVPDALEAAKPAPVLEPDVTTPVEPDTL